MADTHAAPVAGSVKQLQSQVQLLRQEKDQLIARLPSNQPAQPALQVSKLSLPWLRFGGT